MDEGRRCRATSKQSGRRCKRAAIPGGHVCSMHGGATKAARAAAQRRLAEAEATAMLSVLWDPDSAPVTDPVTALQRLAGKLMGATDVLGAKLATSELDAVTAAVWVRVLRELRQSLEGLERLDLAGKQVQIDQDKARLVAVAVQDGMAAVGMSAEDREVFTRVMLARMRADQAVLLP